MNNGVPFCVAIDQLRPCTTSEALAYRFLQDSGVDISARTGDQLSFVDYRQCEKDQERHDSRDAAAHIPRGGSEERTPAVSREDELDDLLGDLDPEYKELKRKRSFSKES